LISPLYSGRKRYNIKCDRILTIAAPKPYLIPKVHPVTITGSAPRGIRTQEESDLEKKIKPPKYTIQLRRFITHSDGSKSKRFWRLNIIINSYMVCQAGLTISKTK
jgi:hypothetical protein